MNYSNPPDYLSELDHEMRWEAKQERIEENRIEAKIEEAERTDWYLKLPLQLKLKIVRSQLEMPLINHQEFLSLIGLFNIQDIKKWL